MSDDPFESPEWKRYATHAIKELVPMLQDTALTVSLAPSDPSDVDIKFALELGLSIMLDKPIIVVVDEDGTVPPMLHKVAQVVVRGDLTQDATRIALQAAIDDVLKEEK